MATCQIAIILVVIQYTLLLSAQWELLTNAQGPSPRRGHSMVTYTDLYGDIVILFGGRSQYFAECRYNDNWNYTLCGHHEVDKLVTSTIVLASINETYPNCALNCSENGWCHYDEKISDSYCICYDEFRGHNCEIKEFQEFEYDVWYLNVSSLQWTQYDFVDRTNYMYSDDWPWPSGRYEHSAIIKDNKMIIYGGYGPKCLDYCNDIWVWDVHSSASNKWSIITYNLNTTEKLWHHGAFLSNDGNYMYTIGGHRYGFYSNDILQFNLNTYTWKIMDKSNNTILPPTRLAHAYSPHYESSVNYPHGNINNMGYIHGGYHSNYTNPDDTDFLRYLWEFTIDEVNEMVYWYNITYNGLNTSKPTDEYIHPRDALKTEWNRWYAIPFPRMDHLIMHVPNSSYIFLFAGYSSGFWYNDTWRFNLKTQTWIKHDPPYFHYNVTSNVTNNTQLLSRSGHQWTYLPSTHSIVLFGGYGNDNMNIGVSLHQNYYNDTWILNLNGCKGYSKGNECHKNENHGYCYFQFCICNENYWGIGCEYNMCPNSECLYHNHTLLAHCTLCNGYGTCNNGTCICDDGYTGSGCTELSCLNDCNNRGNCTEIFAGDVQCVCNDGYESEDCGLHSCRNNCTNRGVCDQSTGICNCEAPREPGRKFSSPDCALTVLVSSVIEKMTLLTKVKYFILLSIYIMIYN
eukprot:440818_1